MSENTIYLHHKIHANLRELCEDQTPTNSGEYCINCPECLKDLGITANKLYIKSDFSIGFCQRCKSVFINNEESDRELSELMTPEFNFNSNKYELDKIDISYYLNSSDSDISGYSYLLKRNPDLAKVLSKLKFRYRPNKIIIPFFWKSEIFYYQIRTTKNREDSFMPYFCPPINNKPIWINPLNSNNSGVILTEGVFGAIAAWMRYKGQLNTISVQGSYLSKYQLWMLDSLNYSKYYLYFDDDRINESIKDTLLTHNPIIYSDIQLIHSELGDPEDDYLGKTITH